MSSATKHLDRLGVTQTQLDAFCRKWKVAELALFGSVLDHRFNAASDIDVLVSFDPGTRMSLLTHAEMQEELSAMVGRPVDLQTRPGVERSANWIRRESILRSAEPIYRAA